MVGWRIVAGRPKEFDPQQALGVAMEVFWKEGYEAAGMDRLLKEMGVSRQSAYDTFGGKRQLFIAALGAYLDKVKLEIGGMLMDETVTPLGRVMWFLNEIERRTAGGSKRGCLLTNTIIELAPHDVEVRDMASATLGTLEDLLAGLLERARSMGELPASAPDPRSLAKLIVVMFEGALVVTKTHRASTVSGAMDLVRRMVAPDA